MKSLCDGHICSEDMPQSLIQVWEGRIIVENRLKKPNLRAFLLIQGLKLPQNEKNYQKKLIFTLDVFTKFLKNPSLRERFEDN